MIRTAVTCDSESCLALYLEPEELPEGARLEEVITEAGWVLRQADRALPGNPAASDVLAHICPACEAGRGPVRERGDCPTCGGSTKDLESGSTCQYCRRVFPRLADRWC